MKRMRLALTAAAMLAVSAGCGASSDSGQESGNFEGERIELVVPFSPGGGYDSYARSIAGPLGEELGADVVVVNKPGAGGLVATNGLQNARPDGTTLEILNMTGTVGSELAGAEGVRYESATFSYIGQVTTEPAVMTVAADGPYESFDDLVDAGKTLRFAASGPGSNEYVDPSVVSQILGFDVDLVTGFDGSSEAGLALLQGSVDAYSISYSSQQATIASGDSVPVLVLGSTRLEEHPDVPTVLEVTDDPEQLELLEQHVNLIETGRTIAGPPDMDDARLQELRGALEAVLTDSDFMEAAEEAGRPVEFKDGAEVGEAVAALAEAPQEYLDILTEGFE